MFHWQDASSIPEKQRLIKEEFGGRVPQHLFFAVENVSHLTKQERMTIEELFGIGHSFFSKPNGTDTKNLEGSLNLNTLPEDLSMWRVLHIRDGTRMHYSFEFKGQTCHLLQTSAKGQNVINFLDLWSRPPQEKMEREEVTRIRKFDSSEDNDGTVVILDPVLLVPEQTEETRFMVLPARTNPPLFAHLLSRKKGWGERLKKFFE